MPLLVEGEPARAWNRNGAENSLLLRVHEQKLIESRETDDDQIIAHRHSADVIAPFELLTIGWRRRCELIFKLQFVFFGFVTLVIEGTDGKRIRNLIAETKFPAGENTVWWDGMDDLLRDGEAAKHGLYHIPEEFVAPGRYRVRGLWRKAVDLIYEFSIYNAGHPAWEIADKTGAWLANHTPPQSALSVPGDRAPNGQPLVFRGSYVSEGGHGLAWVDLDGRKQGGVGWVGGNWTGAPYLARDDGPQRAKDVLGYAAAAWSDEEASRRTKTKVGEIRLTALQAKEHKLVLKYQFTPPPPTNGQKLEWSDYIGGMAVRDNLIVVSLTGLDQLVFVDAKEKRVLGTVSVPRPRGLAFDQQGHLMVLSDKTLALDNGARRRPVLFAITGYLI